MRRKIILILVILVAANCWVIAQKPLKIMTFNVRYDEALFHKGKAKPTHWANRKLLQVELIQKHKPDVIGMQEPHLHQVQFLDEKLKDYSWLGVGRDDGKTKNEFNPIFYRKDKMNLIESGTFWLSETPEVPGRGWDAGYTRICTWALFEDKISKKQFYLFNTHFDSKGKEARLKSADLLNKKMEQIAKNKPVFVCGDFNFQPDSESYNIIINESLKDSKNIVETESVGPDGTFNGFRYGAHFNRRIDFIFVNNKVEVKNYMVVDYSKEGIYPSDHFPVLIEVNIELD